MEAICAELKELEHGHPDSRGGYTMHALAIKHDQTG